MCVTAAASVAYFGSELVDLGARQKEKLRAAVSKSLWRGNTWCKCAATTFTLVAPGHLLHPVQATAWQALTVMHRLLMRRLDLRAVFVTTWRAVTEGHVSLTQLQGPVRRLFEVVPFCKPRCRSLSAF